MGYLCVSMKTIVVPHCNLRSTHQILKVSLHKSRRSGTELGFL